MHVNGTENFAETKSAQTSRRNKICSDQNLCATQDKQISMIVFCFG